ncbi:hypothetical protein WJX84_012357 [Apatococcus fuscideae]|uniref:Uncharacterized protein n=1 Tax=Apatococcus fuscideae TaxID=2026836 RepID=A0AAW1SLK8_9CHLO
MREPLVWAANNDVREHAQAFRISNKLCNGQFIKLYLRGVLVVSCRKSLDYRYPLQAELAESETASPRKRLLSHRALSVSIFVSSP